MCGASEAPLREVRRATVLHRVDWLVGPPILRELRHGPAQGEEMKMAARALQAAILVLVVLLV